MLAFLAASFKLHLEVVGSFEEGITQMQNVQMQEKINLKKFHSYV